MKKYTIHFLLLTILTFGLGFTGIEFAGASVVRFVCLLAGIGLLLSCLDAVILTKRDGRIKKRLKAQKIRK